MIRDKSKIVEQLGQIVDLLILNGTLTNCPGLIHGKTGIAVFFFHYARYTSNKFFEDQAMILIESIQQQILQQHTVDYADGLAGIGAAIEYLEQNNFVEVDTNEALEDIDRAIFNAVIFGDHTDAGFFTGLSGLAYYLLFRVTGRFADDNYISTLDNKMLLIHITDTFERIFPLLKKTECEDVIRFLHALNQTCIYPSKARRLIQSFSSSLPPSKQEDSYRKSVEANCESKFHLLLSTFQDRTQAVGDLGLYGGLAGAGLFLLSQLDNTHDTWKKLLWIS